MPSRAALDKWASQELDLFGYNNPAGGGPNAKGPNAPTGLVATPGVLQASVAFVKPTGGGGAPTTYQFKINNGAWTARQTGTTASPVVITGLSAGAQTIYLRAMAGAVAGDSSAGVACSPTATTRKATEATTTKAPAATTKKAKKG